MKVRSAAASGYAAVPRPGENAPQARIDVERAPAAGAPLAGRLAVAARMKGSRVRVAGVPAGVAGGQPLRPGWPGSAPRSFRPPGIRVLCGGLAHRVSRRGRIRENRLPLEPPGHQGEPHSGRNSAVGQHSLDGQQSRVSAGVYPRAVCVACSCRPPVPAATRRAASADSRRQRSRQSAQEPCYQVVVTVKFGQ